MDIDEKSRNKEPARDVFQFHFTNNEVEKLAPITIGRTSFAAHYDFMDRFIYVIGGSDSTDKMIPDCEKFDILNQTWRVMPSLNQERGNPGTMITSDKRYLYVF